MPTQLPRVPSLIPSSFATRAIGRDVSITIFTASSLNSGEKLFFGRGNYFTFPDIHPNGWTVRKLRGTPDGSEVLFESAESDLVALHGGGQPEVRDGGRLTARLQEVAEAAEEVAGSLWSRLVPDEVSLEFGLKVSGGVNWCFAKAQSEGTIKVTLKWAGNAASAAPPGT